IEVGGNGTMYCVFLKARAVWQKHLETGDKQVTLQQLFLEELGARRASDYDDAGKQSLLIHRGQMLASEILVRWLRPRH
ncbi:MAG: hypothetical protein NUV85_02315, partial [Candidatus Berkelbacteria bacterium]|nr:hypothetical protein [Candidatus Berkelbacteria bacterium]